MIFVKRKNIGKKYNITSSDFTEIRRLEGKDISNTIPLTKRVINNWIKTANNVGFATFKNLDKNDIISIVSGTKRKICHIDINRWEKCTYYILYKDKKELW
jgi:hypothetical protein